MLSLAASVSLICHSSVCIRVWTPGLQSVSCTRVGALQRNLGAPVASSGFPLDASGIWECFAYLDSPSNNDSWRLLQAFHLFFCFDAFLLEIKVLCFLPSKVHIAYSPFTCIVE